MSKTNKIKVYKNRWGKEPIVVAEMKMSEFNRPIGFTQQSVEDLKFNTTKPLNSVYQNSKVDSGIHPPMIPTKSSDYTGMIWCPYIPLMISDMIERKSVLKKLRVKLEELFFNLCIKNYKSDYINECVRDLYENHGKPYLMVCWYSNKEVNPDYYSKIRVKDAEN